MIKFRGKNFFGVYVIVMGLLFCGHAQANFYACSFQSADVSGPSKHVQQASFGLVEKEFHGFILVAGLKMLTVQSPDFQHNGESVDVRSSLNLTYVSSGQYEVWIHHGQSFYDSVARLDYPHTFQVKLPNGKVLQGGCNPNI